MIYQIVIVSRETTKIRLRVLDQYYVFHVKHMMQMIHSQCLGGTLHGKIPDNCSFAPTDLPMKGNCRTIKPETRMRKLSFKAAAKVRILTDIDNKR